ncbi:uncharacterized protein LOC117643646 [Thrips palmi]|uniref:Uncharacterized protein LOC117643646 n=1 Tax=Thrips palmi TaxID=161013 RepID=A0A6P8YNT6_THRPL|nr:uncharacterized protein LOC117643646 [Thrips palmi]
MRKCSYGDCEHKEVKGSKCKFYRLPASTRKCQSWMDACKFKGTPRKMAAALFVCSCHFVGGRGPTRENPVPIKYQRTDPAGDTPNAKSLPRAKMVSTLSPPIEDPPLNCFEELDADVDDPSVDVAEVNKSSAGPVCKTPNQMMDVDAYSPQSNFSVIRPGGTGGSFSSLAASLPNSFEGSPNPSQENVENDMTELRFKLNKQWRESEVKVTNNERAKPMEEQITEEEEEESAHGTEEASEPVLKRTIGIQSDMATFSYDRSKQWNDDDFHYFTGISRKAFEILFELVGGETNKKMKYRHDAKTPQRELYASHSVRDKLFLTLVRLRRGYSLREMKMFFNLPESTISNIFTAWVRTLSEVFKSMEDAIFVSVPAQEKNKPDCYAPFPNLRCVVDSTDIKIQKPSNMDQQSHSFSKYKAHNIVKFLFATSLYGGLSFASEGMEGVITDRQLFLKSGIMKYLKPGEAVMCDRGFDMEEDLNDIGVDILIPAFLGDHRTTFTEREILLSKCVAGARIHVETFIGRVKFFKLIRNVVPNTMIDILSDVVRVCANLVNFEEPFINWNTKKKEKRKKKSQVDKM